MKIHFKAIGSLLIACAVVLPSGDLVGEVKSTPVTGESFVGDYYFKESSAKKTVILYFGGSEGGRPDSHLPRFFTRSGYPALAVAYFKEEGLPETLQMVPLEYFDQPIDWIQRKHKGSQIVVVGASKGAELALLLASRKPEINGVIALSPSSVVWDGLPKSFWPPAPKSSWSVGGAPVPFVPYDYSKGFAAGDPRAIHKFYQQSLTQTEAVRKGAIRVEKISGPILLLSGVEDQVWPSAEMGDAIVARLKKKGFPHKYEHLKYEGAGHTLNEFFMLGGTPKGNHDARLDSCAKMVQFLQALDEKVK